MIRLTLLFVLLLGWSARCRTAEPLQIRVLSYNIHHGEGIDRRLDLARIAEVIQSVSPDLVALQEVDKKATRSSVVDQPAELARLTGMKVIFGGNIPLQGGEYGSAILSKWDINGCKGFSCRWTRESSANDGSFSHIALLRRLFLWEPVHLQSQLRQFVGAHKSAANFHKT